MKCDRCKRQITHNPTPFGTHTGLVQLLCPTCADFETHWKKGFPLPKHRVFTEARELLRRASNYLASRFESNNQAGRTSTPQDLEKLREQTNRIREDFNIEPVGIKPQYWQRGQNHKRVRKPYQGSTIPGEEKTAEAGTA